MQTTPDTFTFTTHDEVRRGRTYEVTTLDGTSVTNSVEYVNAVNGMRVYLCPPAFQRDYWGLCASIDGTIYQSGGFSRRSHAIEHVDRFTNDCVEWHNERVQS